MMLSTLDDVRLIKFPSFCEDNGTLVVFEGASNNVDQSRVPFLPVRVFTAHTESETMRGNHAHKECNQLLVCVAGSCRVRYCDGLTWREVDLQSIDDGLLLPAGIWAEQHFGENSALMVLADRFFSEADYIREFSQFLEYRSQSLTQP